MVCIYFNLFVIPGEDFSDERRQLVAVYLTGGEVLLEAVPKLDNLVLCKPGALQKQAKLSLLTTNSPKRSARHYFLPSFCWVSHTNFYCNILSQDTL